MAHNIDWAAFARGAAYGLGSNVAIRVAGGMLAAFLFAWPVPRKDALFMCLSGAFMSWLVYVVKSMIGGAIKGGRLAANGRGDENMESFYETLDDVSKRGLPEEHAEECGHALPEAMSAAIESGQNGYYLADMASDPLRIWLHVFCNGRRCWVALDEEHMRALSEASLRGAEHLASVRQSAAP